MSANRGKTSLALTRVWHHASAQDRVLGNLASRIAWVLMGKHKPTYDPAGTSPSSARMLKEAALTFAVDAGDYVIVSDALSVRLTGKKPVDKIYRHHSGFMGGLKEVPITRMRQRRPEEIIRRAVSGMLPKNTFRDRRLDRLRIFPAEVPESVMGNVLRTWRDTTGGVLADDAGPPGRMGSGEVVGSVGPEARP